MAKVLIIEVFILTDWCYGDEGERPKTA